MLRVFVWDFKNNLFLPLYAETAGGEPDRHNEKFEVTAGWINRFMKRYNLSLKRKTSVVQDCVLHSKSEKSTKYQYKSVDML